MKTRSTVACALLFLSVAGFAQTSTRASLSPEAVAAILGTPAASGSCGAQPLFAKTPPVQNYSSCTAQCEYVTVSCPTGTIDCSAVNTTCPSAPGYVTCTTSTGTTTISCPACCPDGTLRQEACCQCQQTNDCFACCRCQGGTIGYCAFNC